MDWKENCCAVIPCFNEAANVRSVVAGIRSHCAHVIVVDDGSADATAGVAELAGAQVIRHAKNSGKGAALHSGWHSAAKKKFDWVLMLDGDGQHAVEEIPKFFDCAERTGAKLVVGNRMNDAEKMPPLRRWVNRWMSRRISRLTGGEMPDSQCGFRLAHLKTLLRLSLAANRFEMESEMLVAFAAAGRKVEFVPVQAIYKNGASKIHPLADTLRWLRWRWARRKINPRAIFLAPAALAKTFSDD